MIAKLSDNFYTHPFPRLQFSIKTRMVNSTRLSFSDGLLQESFLAAVSDTGHTFFWTWAIEVTGDIFLCIMHTK